MLHRSSAITSASHHHAKMVRFTSMATLWVLTFFSLVAHAWLTSDAHKNSLNVTADLEANTVTTEFELHDWKCLDDLQELDCEPRVLPRPPECKCFLNFRCGLEQQSEVRNNSLWFRCYQPDHSSLDRLIQLGSSHPHTSLRADLMLSNHDIVSHFINNVLKKTSFILKSLTISGCELEHFPSGLLSDPHKTNLEFIDFSYNQLSEINLSQLKALQAINLRHNNLTSLAPSDLPLDFLRLLQHGDSRVYLNLADNQWVCDDKLDWLVNAVANLVRTNGQMFIKPNVHALSQTDEPECAQPTEAHMFPFSVWKSVQSELCHRCDCYLSERRYAEAGYRYMTVNCTARGFTSIPLELPRNTKILDLSNNRIRSISSLGGSPLFSWRHIHTIYLTNNSIESLEGIDHLPRIVTLHLSGNLLTEIPYHLLTAEFLSRLDRIYIGENPYICDCNTVKMQKWLHTNYRVIGDSDMVRCCDLRPELKNETQIVAQVEDSYYCERQILTLLAADLCPLFNSVLFYDIFNGLLVFSIVLLMVKMAYDYWWQRRTGKLPRFFKLNV